MAQRSANHACLGRALRRRRKELGRTQAEVSGQAGMNRSYYGALERGQRNATVEQIFKLEGPLQTRASELFRQAESDQPASG